MLDLAAVRARIVLASIVEGKTQRRGRSLPSSPGCTLTRPAGSAAAKGNTSICCEACLPKTHRRPPGRLRRIGQLWPAIFGAMQLPGAWSTSAPSFGDCRCDRTARLAIRQRAVSFYPVLSGNIVLVNDGQRIVAVRSDNGKPAWGQAVIYQDQVLGETPPGVPSGTLGVPRFTMSVFDGKLLARMGWPITNQPRRRGTAVSSRPSRVPRSGGRRAAAVEGRAGGRLGPGRLAGGRRPRRVRRHAPSRYPAAGVRGLFRTGHGQASLATLGLQRRDARPRRGLRKHSQSADALRRPTLLQHEPRRHGRAALGGRAAAVGNPLSSCQARRSG